MEIKIGDRVKAICKIDGFYPTTGEEGEVIGYTGGSDYDVLFDSDVDGWGEGYRTLICNESEIELISTEVA